MKLLRFLFEGVVFAVNAIRAYKVRSLLTMIGVATGIFLLTLILTMVNSLKRTLTENLADLGNTTMFIHNWPWTDTGENWFKYLNRPRVSYKEYQKLESRLDPDEIQAMMYQAMASGQTIKAQGRSVSQITVVGGTGDADKVKDLEFQEGRYFTELELRNGSPVCIVGHNIAEGLFPDESALGKYIRLKNKRLRIIGIGKQEGESMFGSEDDNMVLPYLVMPRIYNLNRRMVDKMIIIKLANYENMDYMESEIRGAMRGARGLKPKVEDNFAINKQEALMNQLDSVFGIMETAGWVISLLSLMIGGFSIGNIMYISVKERTKEIGIQKALGSTSEFILYQFMMEAVLICLLGGLMGLALVIGSTLIIQQLLSSFGSTFSVYVTAYEVLLSMGLSSAIGIVAGIVPAWIGARVDPVIAIRHS